MAKKKEPNVDDAIKFFGDVMDRALLKRFYYLNSSMLSKNSDDNKILIVPDNKLWEQLSELEEWKDESKLKEIDVTNDEEYDLQKWFEYSNDLDNHWLEIDVDQGLYTGKVFKIKINNYEYNFPVNRDMMPMKLRKNEYEGVSYKVFSKPLQVLAIKKRFNNVLDGFGFTIIRLFQII